MIIYLLYFPVPVYAEHFFLFPLTVTWPKKVYINDKQKYYKTLDFLGLQSRLGRLLG